MDSTKPTYEPVATEDTPLDTPLDASAIDAADDTPIVSKADETPAEVAAENEKNAEKTAAAEKAAELPVDTTESNGNVTLDLDSSVVPLKDAEELPDEDEKKEPNGKVNGENGMVSAEIEKEEMQLEAGEDLKEKKAVFRRPTCPKCPSIPAPKCPSFPLWRPTWSPLGRKQVPTEDDEEAKEVDGETAKETEALTEGEALKEAEAANGDVHKDPEAADPTLVEGTPGINRKERFCWIIACILLLVGLILAVVFATVGRQGTGALPWWQASHHGERPFAMHLGCDCTGNDLLVPVDAAAVNATLEAAAAANATVEAAEAMLKTAASTAESLVDCLRSCAAESECQAAVYVESTRRCSLKSRCLREDMAKTEGSVIGIIMD